MMSVAQYIRFLTIGALVGAITVLARELFSVLLGNDGKESYSVSIVLAYGIGIAVSFAANRRFTFAQAGGAGSLATFAKFVVVALVGLVLTWSLAVFIRYHTPVSELVGSYSGTLAFVFATLISSIATYPLNSVVVFRVRA
jgi:putative flippase GtrA